MMLEELGSRGDRQVWIRRGSSECVLFLEAELYLERVLFVPPLYGEPDRRRVDFTCNDGFADFLALELVPWLGAYERVTLCGLSLSGLAAAHAALRHPSVFHRAICQSPSAWWNDEWLSRHVPAGPGPSFYISVGDRETAENVDHGHPDLFQVTSQADSCRRLAEDLRVEGHPVEYREFAGGHDAESWRADLETVGFLHSALRLSPR